MGDGQIVSGARMAGLALGAAGGSPGGQSALPGLAAPHSPLTSCLNQVKQENSRVLGINGKVC